MNRTASMVAGIVLLVVGAFVFFQGGSFTSRKDVVNLGDVKLTTQETRAVPPWAAGIAVVAGVALLAAGAKKPA